MALTRAMVAKLASQSSVDVSTSPARTRHRYPSSSSCSSCSSSSSTSSFSTPHTPMHFTPKDSFSFSSCVSLSSQVQKFTDVVDSKFKEMSSQFEHMCIRLSNVEESINDQHSIINEIERELSVVAYKLKKLSSKSSVSLSSQSGADKLHKSFQTDQNCSSSSSHHMSPRRSSSRPDPIVSHPPCTSVSYKSLPPYKSALSHVFAPSPRAAIHWRSAPSTRPIIPLPSSTLPRHTAPPDPSFPSRCSSFSATPSRPIPQTPSYNQSYLHRNSNARIVASKQPSPISRSASKKQSILILGDSNTKHIKLSGAYNIVRDPTFLIQDINPARCKGFGRAWIHCGINNLKYNRCTNYSCVKDKFKMFMNNYKLGAIRNLCPETEVYVSPILPCAIPGLNERAGWFNSLLFSVKHIWWNELKISSFCCNEIGMLANQFRSFRNRGDKIHLGMHGIKALECALLSELNKINGRLYSSVVFNH